MKREEGKLCKLNLCDMLLPPHRFFKFGFEGGEKIVEVHAAVHECVDDSQHCSVAARKPFGCHVTSQSHAAVMVAVKERHLRVFLFEHNEDLEVNVTITNSLIELLK